MLCLLFVNRPKESLIHEHFQSSRVQRGHACRSAPEERDTRKFANPANRRKQHRHGSLPLLRSVADGQLPLYLAKGAKILAEERRLLYVAITRARESLRLYFAPVDHARSQQRFEKRSRFLRPKSVMHTVRVALSEPPR